MGVLNHTAMRAGAQSLPLNHVAWTQPDPAKRGGLAKSRVSRVGSTARKTGSGVAGLGRG